jgi:arylsulfatase A-like enzyme
MPARNVIVVLCDQLRRSALSCYGDPNVETPNVDRLAEEGVRFENACSTYPVCVPARFTMVTGEYAHTRGVPSIDYSLSPAEDTIADAFSAAGHETAHVGKWHLAGHHRFHYDEDHDETARRLNRMPIPEDKQGGFDYFRGFEVRNDPFDTCYFADDDPEPRAIDGYQTDGIFELGTEYVADAEDPFFLTVSVEPPHPPFSAPREYLERWQDRAVTFPPNFEPREYPSKDLGQYRGPDEAGPRAELGMVEGIEDELRAYYAMVENVDDNVGRLLDALEAAGIREETAVVFLSDHGELLGSHGLLGKQRPYAESVGVPFVVSLPGEIDDGRAIAAPTCTEDWFPTLLGLAGVDPGETPGRNLAPLARGESDALDRPGVMLEFVAEQRAGGAFAEETWRGFRTERYKYTVKGGATGGEPWQLFDLESDPYEQENLLDDPDAAAERVAGELHGHLRVRLDETGDTYGLKPAFGHDGLGYWENS